MTNMPEAKLAREAEPCYATGGCRKALDHAIITAPDARNAAMAHKLQAVAGRVLK